MARMLKFRYAFNDDDDDDDGTQGIRFIPAFANEVKNFNYCKIF